MIIQQFGEDLTEVVDNMSVEYQLVTENSSFDDILKKIIAAIENSELYNLSYSSSNSIGVSINGSSSSWGADFEITHSNGGFFVVIHSGNARKILLFIEAVLSDSNINFEIEEV